MSSFFQNFRKIPTISVFYVLVMIIALSFTVASYMHYNTLTSNLNTQIKNLENIYVEYKLPKEDVLNSSDYERLQRDYNSQTLWVIGQYLVFLVILGFGTYQVKASLDREMNLARQQKNFMLSITHELKSPIAGIKLAMETMLSRELDAPKRKLLSSNALKDSIRLHDLVNNILMAAKIEDESFEFKASRQNLSSLTSEIAKKLQETTQANRAFTFDIKDKVFIEADRMAITSIVTNLIENAIKYTENGDAVIIRLREEANKVRLSIIDTGVGVAEHEKQNIFQKFYRVGDEEVRKTKGTGLGLFIVKQLVERHKGTIGVGDNQPKGSIFTVVFPVAQLDKTDSSGAVMMG